MASSSFPRRAQSYGRVGQFSKTRLTIIFLLGLCPPVFGAQSRIALVGEEIAHKLAVSTLADSGKHLSGMRFGREEQMGDKMAGSAARGKEFYWFDITANAPDMASPLVGYFAVNKITGDVWDPVTCRKLRSSFIRRFQQQLRQRTVSGWKFRDQSLKAPCEP